MGKSIGASENLNALCKTGRKHKNLLLYSILQELLREGCRPTPNVGLQDILLASVDRTQTAIKPQIKTTLDKSFLEFRDLQEF